MAKNSATSPLAFDPDTVLPKKELNWIDFLPSSKEDKARKKSGKDELASWLPRRLSLKAFSHQVGWRPAGLNIGQVKFFVERFPQEFRLASMGKIIMPHLGGDPYVAPDGKLPCPWLSSANALKVLQSPGRLDSAHSNVRAELERVFQEGVQVEWSEFPDYMSYMVYYEGAAVQGEVNLKPHIIDTAMLYLGFCDSKRGRAIHLQAMASKNDNSANAAHGLQASDADTRVEAAAATAAAAGSGGIVAPEPEPTEVRDTTAKIMETVLADGCKALEDGFIQAMSGKNAHRFYECKRLLRNTELEVLTNLATWRKKAHFCHANALSQHWFLSPEWGRLKHLKFRTEMCEQEGSLPQSISMQQCCADIIMRMLSQSEISKKSDVPKLGRPLVNMDVFKEVTTIPHSAVDYFQGLRQKHPQAWSMMSAGSKLARRLLVDGESGLRQCFLAAYEQVGRSVCALNFMETAVGSEFAMVEEKLHTCTLKLLAEAKQAEETAAAAAAEVAAKQQEFVSSIFAETDVTGAGADADAEALRSGKQQVAPVRTAEQIEEEARLQAKQREEAALEQERQAEAERKRKEEKMEMDSIQSEARIAIDDVWTIYNDLPHKGCPPVAKVQACKTAVYVVPTQSYVRGRPGEAAPILQMQGLEVLDWVTAADILLIGVGHDPAVVTVLMTNLKSHFPNIKVFTWQPLIPIIQPRRKKGSTHLDSYVEYLLIGCGPDSDNKLSAPGFLQVKRGFPSVRLRPVTCNKCVFGAKPSGCDELCEVHTWARSRFTTALPGNPPRKQKKKVEAQGADRDLADLMGEEGDASAASDDGSGDGGDLGAEDNEAEESEEENTPAVTNNGKAWLGAWRWGWPPETWSAFLEALAPSLVVLCGSVHLQPGLLMSVLSYNDARFGLARCELFAFYPRDCASRDEDARPREKHIEQGHIADHVLERVSSVYADFRLAAHKATQKRSLNRAESREDARFGAVKRQVVGNSGDTAAAPGLEAGTAPQPAAAVAASAAAGTAAEPGQGELAVGCGIAATKFIGVHNNCGPRMTLIPLPIERSEEDSDADETGANAASMVHADVSKRNQNMMAKHKVKVSKSTGPDGTGLGLFTKQPLAAGASIPAKGVWYASLGELNEWLGSQPTRTAEVMAKKVVELNFCVPPDTETKVTKYFVMTSIAGYVNAYTNIAQRPNAQLVFNHDRPLGQYSLKVLLTQDLSENREILIAYGVKHMVRESKTHGAARAAKRRRKSEAAPVNSELSEDGK